MRNAVAALTVLVALSAHAQTDRQKLSAAFPEVEKLFDAFVERSHMRGATMGILVDGDLVWTRTTGLQSLGGAPVTLDSVFRIASMTKSFTAAAILKLRDEGKLSLDDPAAKYVPELAKLAYPSADSPAITIRHLLTHSEGFPEDNPWGDRQLGRPNEAMSAWMKAGIPFSTTPGTAYEYSNYGFAILGQIVERVSGKPYDESIRTAILAPLGMTSSTFEASQVPAERKAIGYRWQDEAWVEEPILPHGSFGAMGGLWTTTRDLAKWVTFLMSAYPPRNGADDGPVKRSSLREMQQLARFSGAGARRPAVDAPLQMTASGYGYGLGVSADCRFRHIVSHGGGLPGYGSLMQWLPQYGVGLIFMSNRTYGSSGALFNDTWNALRTTDALQPRKVTPSPALLEAQKVASTLLTAWNDTLATEWVADNFFLDKSADRWKKETAERAEKHGKCSFRPIEAENALRGRWRVTCEQGWIDAFLTLAPTMPPRIQYLSATSVMPPDATMTARIDAALKGTDADAKLKRQLAAMELMWGQCKPSEALRGDGKVRTSMKLACEKGAAVAEVELDPESKKIKTFELVPAGDQPCVP